MASTTAADFCVIGGGIVGLATAYELVRRLPDQRVMVVEKESRVAAHQSGHNSGVLHAGIYYRPGSLKARLCRAGKAAMEQFCAENGIPTDRCGKVVVASVPQQLTALDEIVRRAAANGVACERIDTDALRQLEPHAAGLGALHVAETGIVDYRQVCQVLAQRIEQAGGRLQLGACVRAIRSQGASLELHTDAGIVRCAALVNCAGLYSDRIARMAGADPKARIVPFRGEYYELLPQHRGLCRNLIYPVPDPAFPFLGVHFTRMIDGSVECGPNAVLALARQGYRWREIAPGELASTLAFGGFQRLARRYWRSGLVEMWRSLSKGAFVRALQQLVPEVRAEHLRPARAGVRAQAVTPQGELVDDFLIERTQGATHVLNAPSPAATASLAIAGHIVDVALGEAPADDRSPEPASLG